MNRSVKIITFFLTTLFISQNSIGQKLNESLLLHYPFNGDANNALSANYNLPSSYYPILCADRFGYENSAYYFNGNGGFTLYNKSLNNQSLPQSISLWFKTENNQPSTFSQLLCGFEGPDESRFFLGIKYGKLSLEYGVGNFGTEHISEFTSQTYNDNLWHHAVFISEGDNQKGLLYVDGIKTIEIPTGINHNNQMVNFKIGGNRSENFYTGSIDDVRVYYKTLTELEVNYLRYEYPCLNTITTNKSITTTEALVISLPIPMTIENKTKTDINIYPNPAIDNLVINIGDYSTISNYVINIVNVSGHNIFESFMNKNEFTIDISNLPKGNYFVRIIDNNSNIVETRKITIE